MGGYGAAPRSRGAERESAEDAVGDERWQVPVGHAFGDQIATQYFAVDFGFNPVAGERTLGLGVAPKRATLPRSAISTRPRGVRRSRLRG